MEENESDTVYSLSEELPADLLEMIESNLPKALGELDAMKRADALEIERANQFMEARKNSMLALLPPCVHAYCYFVGPLLQVWKNVDYHAVIWVDNMCPILLGFSWAIGSGSNVTRASKIETVEVVHMLLEYDPSTEEMLNAERFDVTDVPFALALSKVLADTPMKLQKTVSVETPRKPLSFEDRLLKTLEDITAELHEIRKMGQTQISIPGVSRYVQ